VNKELYGQIVALPEELINYLQQCFEQVPNSDSTVEGHKRNVFLRDNGQVTFQQLERIQNWFKYFDGNKEDTPYVLNGGDYMNNWVSTTIDGLRRGTQTPQITQDVMPDDVNDDLIDDMGWLSNMNRDAKSHKGYNDDIKITENLKRINDIIKKII
jgi:uncharacterized protein YgfB (UPF0149 family)